MENIKVSFWRKVSITLKFRLGHISLYNIYNILYTLHIALSFINICNYIKIPNLWASCQYVPLLSVCSCTRLIGWCTLIFPHANKPFVILAPSRKTNIVCWNKAISVIRYWIHARGSRFGFPVETEFLFFPPASTTARGSRESSIQWVPRRLSRK